MSGIAGIIHFDGAPVLAGQVESMTSAMAHRGPDGIRHWVSGPVALGQCLLRTTPESMEECQPLANEDASLVLVMDGRVDNWEALRWELLGRGTVLRDRSDAELMLRAYEAWGEDCLGRIDGDFALAVWDSRRRRVFCARDRMGRKPFNYHWNGKTLAFASELQAILKLPWVGQISNEGMLAEWLAGQWRSRDETLWAGISRLVAAHRMVAGAGGPRPEVYWEPEPGGSPFRTDEEYIEGYREVLLDSVRRLSRSHRPVAIDVSGGLDSSAVFCVAEYLRRAKKLPAPAIEGYTLAFTEADGEAYELPYARAAGEFLGLQIHEIPPSRMPLAWFAERARAEREFPGFPNSAAFVGLWRQAVATGSRVSLSGDGGDAWLQGSRAYYAEELSGGCWLAVIGCLKADVAAIGARQAVAAFARHGVFRLLPPTLQGPLRRWVHALRGRADSAEPYWLSPHMQEILARRPPPSPQARRGTAGQRELLELLGDAFIAQITESDERLAAQAGIEVRDPFSDRRFVQYAFSTPTRLHLRGDRTKYMHVQALKNLMPRIILERKSKAEFSSVFRAKLDHMRETLTEEIPLEREAWVSPEGMARLFDAYHGNPQNGMAEWILWSIYGCHEAGRQ